jgi:hypothetical protein
MTIDYKAIQSELAGGHPETGAYDADDQLAANQLNKKNRTGIKASMTGSDFFLATDPTEFGSLTEAKKSQWLSFCAIDTHVPENDGVAHKFVIYIFGASNTTLSNLATARNETISRATELGLNKVHIGDIQNARII